MNRKEKGDLGEELAELYLERKGYSVLARNYRLRTGEIDIIAQKDDCYHFIEVKLRSGVMAAAPAEQITKLKLLRITRTIQHYLAVQKLDQAAVSVDVIEVRLLPGGPQLNHLINIT